MKLCKCNSTIILNNENLGFGDMVYVINLKNLNGNFVLHAG